MVALDRRGTWAIGIVVLLALFLLLSRCAGGSGSTRVGAVPDGQGPAEPAPPPTAGQNPRSDDDTETDSGERSGGEPQTGPGTLTVDGNSLLPLAIADGVGPNGSLSRLAGRRAVAQAVRVLTVPADEGFWVGLDRTDRVWVQLTGPPPESPYTVRPGDSASFTARITPNGKGYARAVGVDRAEGAATLTAQRQHLEVAKRTLRLDHPAR
jgi:hypothetical protein